MNEAPAFNRLGIGWQIGVPSGWGTYGVNLSVELVRRGLTPELFFRARSINLMPDQLQALEGSLARQPEWFAAYQRGDVDLEFPMLHALGDRLDFPDMMNGIKGRPNVGVVFFESATIPQKNLAAAQNFALIITGSSWNTAVLRDYGLANVRNCPQVIDPSVFAPIQKKDKKNNGFSGRFAVFSGGKLEYRKGQDIVVAAFKIFHQRHADAILVSAWHNPWPEAAKGIGISHHVSAVPSVDSTGHLDVSRWLYDCGLPPGAFIDLGPMANVEMAKVLHEVDLAVFPNRCEGGTNLVAMESMACGVPVILSANTGHLDLIQPDNCYTLDLQIPIDEVTGRRDLEGWGESSIDELVTKMEAAYQDREDAARRGAAAGTYMIGWGWKDKVGRLINAVSEFC